MNKDKIRNLIIFLISIILLLIIIISMNETYGKGRILITFILLLIICCCGLVMHKLIKKKKIKSFFGKICSNFGLGIMAATAFDVIHSIGIGRFEGIKFEAFTQLHTLTGIIISSILMLFAFFLED